MKIGIKIYRPGELKFIKKFLGKIDFLEVMALDGYDYSPVKELEIPTVVHNMHFGWGVNFSNINKYELNKASLQNSIKIANMLNSKVIIVHPELIENIHCSDDYLASFLGEFKDDRIIIESMPYVNEGLYYLGYDYFTMKRILDKTNRRMCLDLAHSSEAAAELGREPVKFIKEMLSLKPAHFHISDTKLESFKDMHRHLEEGNVPVKVFRKIIPEDAWVTVETSHQYTKVKHDIEFLRG